MPLAVAIAGSSSGAYLAPMLAAILRLLTIAALALMPFGMAAASAAVPVHHPQASSSAGHCDDQDGEPSRESQDPLPGCSAGCSMFMAEKEPTPETIVAASQSTAASIARRWSSLPPETATPPPKPA